MKSSDMVIGSALYIALVIVMAGLARIFGFDFETALLGVIGTAAMTAYVHAIREGASR